MRSIRRKSTTAVRSIFHRSRGEPPERNVRTHAGLVGSLERRRREKILPLPAAGDSSARRRRRKVLSVKRQNLSMVFAVPLRRCDGRLPRSILRFLDRARWNFTYIDAPRANSRTRARKLANPVANLNPGNEERVTPEPYAHNATRDSATAQAC